MPCLMNNIQCSYPDLQPLIGQMSNAQSFNSLVTAGWHLGLKLAVILVEEILAHRAKKPTQWPVCPECGKTLHSKGFRPRQLTTVLGIIHFSRRVGRCPNRCRIGQVAPLDNQLEIGISQKSGDSLKRIVCLLAVFVPFQTAEALLKQLTGVSVNAKTIWHWVQQQGQRAIDILADQLQTLSQEGDVSVEPIDAATQKLQRSCPCL